MKLPRFLRRDENVTPLGQTLDVLLDEARENLGRVSCMATPEFAAGWNLIVRHMDAVVDRDTHPLGQLKDESPAAHSLILGKSIMRDTLKSLPQTLVAEAQKRFDSLVEQHRAAMKQKKEAADFKER